MRVEERTYVALPATLDVLMLRLDYRKVNVKPLQLTVDTTSRIIELLKAVNSWMCQPVLGTGAMRSARIKNIVARHHGTLTIA